MEKRKTKGEVFHWLTKFKVKNFTIHDDLTINLFEGISIDTSLGTITHLPIMFNKIEGNASFSCGLTSLEGMPSEITGDFELSNATLKSLQDIPQIIGGNIILNANKIDSLIGLSNEIKGTLYIEKQKIIFDNVITTIKYDLIINTSIEEKDFEYIKENINVEGNIFIEKNEITKFLEQYNLIRLDNTNENMTEIYEHYYVIFQEMLAQIKFHEKLEKDIKNSSIKTKKQKI